MTPPVQIEVQIGALVLHGFPAADHDRIATALGRELTRLLTEQGLPMWANEAEAERLTAGPIAIPPGWPAEAIGERIAQSLYGGTVSWY